ncbi:uncharacterized protein HD556DRAFT_1308923 [Suillus plorans]|uniref:Uncharacterized protein n=1 Tax=Suillus plorans TaxID=116603 RepID=A0A9P7AN44_9AGAM|nr:uncharacterized protein HD556DRAFT_1308923 [Suillus plorans]KAG1792879.1 hypothetical protein HD556DRAFT_1308923 [Suillus plorans]
MPLGKHFCSVGLGMKLASLMSAPEKSSPANSDKLGHVLSLIFKSCATEVPKAKDLKVLLKKIHPDTRIEAFQHIEDEATLVPLYDIGERSNQAGENSSMDQGEREGENSGAMNQRPGDWVFVDDTGTPAASESQAESVGQPEDDVMSTNASSASSDKAPVLHEIDHDSTKPWTASNSSSAICGDEIMCKPDLTLLDDIKARWDTIKAVCLPASQTPTVETLRTVGLHLQWVSQASHPSI